MKTVAQKAYMSAYWRANKERISAQRRARVAANPEIYAARAAASKAKRRDAINAANRAYMRTYNASQRAKDPVKFNAERKEWKRQWRLNNPEKAKQRGRSYRGVPEPTRPMPPVCECCSKPPHGKWKILFVDHNHENGKFRGWLCFKCNVGIGALGDNRAGLKLADDYLVRAECNS